jgi:hypothetical protein
MKRLSVLGFGLLAGLLAGCPIWMDGNSGQPQVCTYGCPTGCTSPSDCAPNETCAGDGQCRPGDCTTWGCASGYKCEVTPVDNTGVGQASCVPIGSTTSTGGGSTTSTGGSTTSTGGSTTSTGGSTTSTGGSTTSTGGSTTSTGGSTTGTGGSPPTPVYCGHPADCSSGQICASDGTCQPGPCSASNTCIYGYSCVSGTCQSPTPNACDSDASCSNGDVCIAGSDGKGGVCTPVANQCFDQSQCGAGENCVAGKCTLGCSSNADCRDGFTCNLNTGVCSGIAHSCTLTNDCGSATLVCVGGACVPRSMDGACQNAGDVWTENGCIPDQAATFICQNDGVQDSCALGSICLHHDCWISCDAATMMPCNTNSQFPQCKPVVDGSSTYNVCGSASNLGSECGAGSVGNASCTGGKVCIDGFCK